MIPYFLSTSAEICSQLGDLQREQDPSVQLSLCPTVLCSTESKSEGIQPSAGPPFIYYMMNVEQTLF